MERTVQVPSRQAPEAPEFANHVGRLLDAKGYTVPTGAILAVLEVITDLATGPRYQALRTPYADGIGNHAYLVVDNRTGRTEEIYEGYFAGQDARDSAKIRNQVEEG